MLGASGIMTTYGGIAEGVAVGMTAANTTNFKAVDTGLKTSTQAQVYPSGTIFSFLAGITKVRVYVWLEGQDVDNEDTASLGTGVGVMLKFKIAGSSGA